MPPEPGQLADTHWKLLRKQRRQDARGLLAQLRAAGGEGAAPAACRALAHALSRAHWDAGRWGEAERARRLLDELRALCRRPGTDEAQRFEMAKALGTAHWDAVRYGDARRAGRLLGELRNLARRDVATEGQRLVLAEALANEIRLQGGPRGDQERIPPLLSDLRRLADREHAPEEQRDALARALLDLHHVARTEPSGEQRVEELRTLAARPAATPAQKLALVEALQDVPWQAGLFGSRARQDALLAAVRVAQDAAVGGQRPRELLCDTLVRMHAKVRRARDDAFADRLLDRLRTVVVHPEADVGSWVALATAVCDGLWIAGTFGNRELAEELVEVLALLTGDVEASTRQRVALAGLLVGAHHRAVRHEDALLSKELLNLLYAWAVRPGAAAEVREVLAHGLELADAHARRRGDEALASKVEAALAALGPPADEPVATALTELAAEA
ncbi:MAG: hypothetical protein QNJ90_00195 [Planctomycetota bacterium]|nr:hypothetical protein [Planctomycetota bacterium]